MSAFSGIRLIDSRASGLVLPIRHAFYIDILIIRRHDFEDDSGRGVVRGDAGEATNVDFI